MSADNDQGQPTHVRVEPHHGALVEQVLGAGDLVDAVEARSGDRADVVLGPLPQLSGLAVGTLGHGAALGDQVRHRPDQR